MAGDDDDSSDDDSYKQIWDVGDVLPGQPGGSQVPAVEIRKFKPEDFMFLKVLGKGSFGKVSKSGKIHMSCNKTTVKQSKSFSK